MPRLVELSAAAERDVALPVMQELFPTLDADRFRGFFEDDDYHLFALHEGGTATDESVDSDETADVDTVVGLAGVSVQHTMHHERHVWVHDLVVTEHRRGEGFGRALLEYAEHWGRERDCDSISLATGIDRDIARLFYEAQGYEEWGSVYERRL